MVGGASREGRVEAVWMSGMRVVKRVWVRAGPSVAVVEGKAGALEAGSEEREEGQMREFDASFL